ncbi:polysaccharide pyruvyl transferase family protein [Vibrio cholerae]|uniref:polysaccharide pyruvyl transferase family protein n=1 Tax=Vibrio cholerae TaxID=666 RepID=UPI0022AFF8CF|nr:polysaccharide pyruvyl transferase family protein [Vibrio cholerae]
MSKETIVEIKGIGFPNKGAELMLSAIISEFDKRGVKAKFAIEPYGDYRLRSKYALYQKARVYKSGIDFGAVIGLLPNQLLNVFGIIKAKDIDVVLDASGFSYGDQWGPDLAQNRLGSTIEKLRKNNKKIILMPQALGPFENQPTRKVAKRILDSANLVFARDDISFQYARDVSPQGNIFQSHDFTNLAKGYEFDGFDADLHKVCFIPNSKMIEKTSSGDEYVDSMVTLINLALEKEAKPFLLIHEGQADRKLAELINTKISKKIPILEPVDPLKIKWVIGKSEIVISSRFHGLVSALCQGVPVLATGWSHKYKCLLEEYGSADSLFDVKSDMDRAKSRLVTLIDDKDFRALESKNLTERSTELKKQVNKMWDKIFSLINNI